MTDYQEIINNLEELRIKQLLDSFKIEYIDKGSHLLMQTVCHHSDDEEKSWKLYYYKDNKLFYCYTECGGMSIFKFLEHYYKSHNIDYNWYEDVFLVAKNCSKNKLLEDFTFVPIEKIAEKYKKKEITTLPIYPNRLMDLFTKFYPIEWLLEGITKETMDKFNIKYSISQNKIIIPHYNVDGQLVGIRGRALDSWEIENVGKYLPVQIENKWYAHALSLNLYGLNKTKENIKENGYCIIYEGEKSVLQAESFKRKNCGVAICGSNLNKYALKILMKECCPKEVIIAFDNEERKNEDIYFNKLYKICQKYSYFCNFSFIYDREKLTKLKDSPTDCGEDIFEYLLKKRVKCYR